MNPELQVKVVSPSANDASICNWGDKIKDMEIIEMEKRT
jgi:hypothetical protein